MHRITRLVLLPLLLVIGSLLPATAQTTSTNKHALWVAKGKTNSIYFLGSIHFLKQEYFPMDPVIEQAFAKSSTAVFETDIDELKDPLAQLKLVGVAQYPPGDSLPQHIDSETYNALKKQLASGVGLDTLCDGFKPWFAAVTVEVLAVQKLGFNPESGIDQYFFEKAKTQKKELKFLETVDFQTSRFTGMDEKDQVLFLKSTLKETDSIEKALGDIILAWKTGNAAKIDELMSGSMKDYPNLYARFLVDRNKSWVPQVEQWFRAGKNVIVIVGAAHLSGKDSLISMLQANGMKIDQL